MFRKQIATEKINNSETLSEYAPLINEVASEALDPEMFYDWLMSASGIEIADWAIDAQKRDQYGYLDNGVVR